MAYTQHDWVRDLRFITDRVNRVPDPIDRLEFLVVIREALRAVLTDNYEKAAWDARRLDRDAEALDYLSAAALAEYSRRYNGRLEGADRIRWADPMHLERRKKAVDLTEVAKGNHPTSIRTGFRQMDPQTPQEP